MRSDVCFKTSGSNRRKLQRHQPDQTAAMSDTVYKCSITLAPAATAVAISLWGMFLTSIRPHTGGQVVYRSGAIVVLVRACSYDGHGSSCC